MQKFHIAISTPNLEQTIADYSFRLGAQPSLVIPGEYALWRTETLNFSIRHDPVALPGSLRHLGWEDTSAKEFSQDQDVNGIIWEQFSAEQQATEIKALWPDASYCVSTPGLDHQFPATQSNNYG